MEENRSCKRAHSEDSDDNHTSESHRVSESSYKRSRNEDSSGLNPQRSGHYRKDSRHADDVNTSRYESSFENSRKQDEEAYREWEAKEKEFNMKQIVAKPLMRFKQGRPKVVDKLVLTVDPDFKESFSESFEASSLFRDESPEDREEALEILNSYLGLGRLPESREFFENLLILIKEPSEKDYQMSGVSQMVAEKIDQILSSKSIQELSVYEDQIKKRLDGGGVVDTNFWEAALSRIPYFKACKFVNGVLGKTNPEETGKPTESTKGREPEDRRERERKDSKGGTKGKVDFDKFVEYTKLEEDEEVFDEVVELKDNNSNPETPRYYNRVKKGFEWTKYNLAHYDQEHPPPKLVQGYRFNIFFPELKGNVPKWKLQKDGNNRETALLRFSGGHPYRDIAFRVVNKEWVTDPQKGFKNFFDNGVLHLYYDFKRIRYRR